MGTVDDVGEGEPAAAGAVPDSLVDDRWARLQDLYRDEQPGLVRLATLLVDDRPLAEELVQDAFVRLHRHLDQADRPGAYLRTTVVNLCRSHHRHRAVVDRTPQEPPREAHEPPLPFDQSEVWVALQGLPERRRTALVLRYYLDLPDAEIADLLGARPATVRSLVHRGLAQLQEVLEP